MPCDRQAGERVLSLLVPIQNPIPLCDGESELRSMPLKMTQPPHPSGQKRLQLWSPARLPPEDVLYANIVAKRTRIVKQKVVTPVWRIYPSIVRWNTFRLVGQGVSV
jgi:hypothetical protein